MRVLKSIITCSILLFSFFIMSIVQAQSDAGLSSSSSSSPGYQCGNTGCTNKMYSVIPVDLAQNAEQICVAKGWGHCAVCDVGYGPAVMHGWKANPNSGIWSNACPSSSLGGFNPTTMEVCCTNTASSSSSSSSQSSSSSSSSTNTCIRKSFGDADCNGVVEEKDYIIWEKSYKGESIASCSVCSADFNNDGKVNLIDFEIWRQNQQTTNVIIQ